MKKLLFITPELPFPAQSGGKVKSLKLLQALTDQYEVTLACPLKLEDATYVKEFHKISPCAAHLHEEVNVPRSPRNLLLSYAKNVPLNVHRTANASLTKAIADVADEFDIIFLDHYEVFPYVPKQYNGSTIYHAHNAYFKMWKRYAQLPGNPIMRAAAWLEYKRVKHYETNVAKTTDITFAAPNDAAELIAQGAEDTKIRNTYHLGDDSQLQLPDLRFVDSEEKLMYVGYLGWEPNSQGLVWFIEHVWPLIKERHPQLTFDIVGKNADEKLRYIVSKRSDIVLRGFVEDLQEVYRQCRVSVAPLLFGSGMKVKVLDALAAGLPTVTTSVGAEGIAIEQDQHLLVADEPREMAAQIHRLLSNQTLWEQIQKNSRLLVAQRYTWAKLFSQMHSDIEQTLRANATSPSPIAEAAANVS